MTKSYARHLIRSNISISIRFENNKFEVLKLSKVGLKEILLILKTRIRHSVELFNIFNRRKII